LKAKINPKVPLDICHLDSKNSGGLQATDMLCWGIFEKYERKKYEWFDIFKSKVKYDSLYLP